MFDLHLVSNHSRAEQWIKDKVQFATINHLDGIELYIDEVVAKDSALVGELNDFVRRVVVAFRIQAPTSVVIFSVPWSPYNEKSSYLIICCVHQISNACRSQICPSMVEPTII